MTTSEHSLLKLSIRKILEGADVFRWTLQGLGMLRLYLNDEVRLHVWDPTFAFPAVSPIHDHPWDFDSYILAGVLTNRIYLTDSRRGGYHSHKVMKIRCGEGGTSVEEPQLTSIVIGSVRRYVDGQRYSQRAHEIHETQAERGTVTIVTRTFVGDRDHANIYWRREDEWGSAEPRPATPEEVKLITTYALTRWF
jgi:hypothetical protein